jgi:hypothetical protein
LQPFLSPEESVETAGHHARLRITLVYLQGN